MLVESLDIKIAAFRDIYAAHGPDVVANVLAHHREHGGISRVVKIRDCHRMFLGIELDDDELTALATHYAEYVEEAVCRCDAVPGADDLLRANTDARRLYVVSGTPQPELRRITDRRGLTGYFEAVYGSPRGKVEIVNEELARLGVVPVDALFVGDAMTDYRAACDTGVPFVGRLVAGHGNPFPAGAVTVDDMSGLAALLRPV